MGGGGGGGGENLPQSQAKKVCTLCITLLTIIKVLYDIQYLITVSMYVYIAHIHIRTYLWPQVKANVRH